MIMINGEWEQVKDLSDIVRIVNENIGYEFAQKVEEIYIDLSEENDELGYKNYILENKVYNMKNKLKEVRKIFVELLHVTNNTLAYKYLEDFDNVIKGEE